MFCALYITSKISYGGCGHYSNMGSSTFPNVRCWLMPSHCCHFRFPCFHHVGCIIKTPFLIKPFWINAITILCNHTCTEFVILSAADIQTHVVSIIFNLITNVVVDEFWASTRTMSTTSTTWSHHHCIIGTFNKKKISFDYKLK